MFDGECLETKASFSALNCEAGNTSQGKHTRITHIHTHARLVLFIYSFLLIFKKAERTYEGDRKCSQFHLNRRAP